MRGSKNRWYQKGVVLASVIGMIMMLAGCGSSGIWSGVCEKTNDINVDFEVSDGYYTSSSYESAAEESFTNESGATSSSQVVDSDRKLIKTVDMDVETQAFEQLMNTIQTEVTELGGYIESMNTYNGSAYSARRANKSASLTIRIPKDKLDSFLNTVSGAGNVVRRFDNVEDVTLQYVDMESHRDVLKAEQERLLEFLAQAETIEDMITLESRLSDVRYQLESMESQLRTFDNQVDYSTVIIDVSEVELYTPVEEETIGERIVNGFQNSLDEIGKAFVEFMVWFIVTLPYMVVSAIIITIIALILRVIIKLVGKSAKKKKAQAGKVQPAALKNQGIQGNTLQNNMQQNVQNANRQGGNVQADALHNQGTQQGNVQNANTTNNNGQSEGRPEKK
ncbi:MAG: DUF4349 domain-containing protein [Lachnospiraceae bacterium]|nr:DUF4349 domain-containing protein [Lachnospiraceae bacterium]